ncbi:MAG: hypothetical protein WB987_04825 [Candidatus Acidiferrales bacterium]
MRRSQAVHVSLSPSPLDRNFPLRLLGLALAFFFAHGVLWAAPRQSQQDLAQEIYDTMAKIPRAKPATRPVHAKGIVCEGTFTASRAAARLSRTGHFQGEPVPVTIRYSDSGLDPSIPDGHRAFR